MYVYVCESVGNYGTAITISNKLVGRYVDIIRAVLLDYYLHYSLEVLWMMELSSFLML